MAKCNMTGFTYQIWKETDVRDSSGYAYSTFQNANTGWCLQGNGAGQVWTTPNCGTDPAYQQFKAINVMNVTTQWQSYAYPGLCLDSDTAGTSVFLRSCNISNRNQLWYEPSA